MLRDPPLEAQGTQRRGEQLKTVTPTQPNQMVPNPAKPCFQAAFRWAPMFSSMILLKMHFINVTHKTVIIKLFILIIGSGLGTTELLKWWEE